MAYDFDYGTLSWVKSEIDETLKQARSALESFVDNTEDETKLRFCINYLHQVHGTLQMVELYGASLVAEEMEQLAQAIVDGKVVHKDDAYEALMRGMLQLPDYLDKVEAGQQDMPVVLMPLLNDLRAARNAPLLSENALFSPDLSISAPVPALEPQEEAGAPEELAGLARKLRHIYHLGLLGWFRDQNRDASLQKIGDVIGQLRHAARGQESGQMLWAAGGVVEGLLDGGLESSVAVKLLLGQVDRQVKRVIDSGEVALSEQPPRDLTKNLLFYVAQSSSAGETVSELKSAFHLDELLPDAKAVDRARESLAGPNASLLETVSKVILDDLARVKDNLDVFVRSDQRDVSGLKPLVDALTQMADTLAMLGLGVQRKTVQEQISVLNAMIADERADDDDALMNVAGALLAVEGALTDVGHVRAANDEAEQAPSAEGIASEEIQVTDPEYHQVVQHAIAEAKTELARIKEAIAAYSSAPAEHDLIKEVPQSLASIRGSLAMLNLDRAAELVDACVAYVTTELLDKHVVPETSSLDTLADAITSIEYYLESIAERWGHPSAILEVAAHSLEALGHRGGGAGGAAGAADDIKKNRSTGVTQASLSDPDATQVMSLDQLAEAAPAAPASPQAGSDVAAVAAERLGDALDMWLLDPADDGATKLLQSVLEQLGGKLPPANAAALAAFTQLSDGVDGIASGEHRADDTNVAALYAARDALAAALGEQAPSREAVESPTLVDLELAPGAFDDAPTQTDLEILDETTEEGPPTRTDLEVPPELADANATRVDLEPLEFEMPAAEEDAQAQGLTIEPPPEDDDGATGLAFEPPGESSAETPAKVAPEPEPPSGASAVPAGVGDEIDEEIIEIFLEEAQEELENIGRLLPQWQANPAHEDTLKDMRRSYHTLKGSGRLVGAVDVGEFAWAFENMLNRVIDHTIAPSDVMFDLLERGRQTLPHLFELFKSGAKPGQEVFGLMEDAQALSQGKQIGPVPAAGHEEAAAGSVVSPAHAPSEQAAGPASPTTAVAPAPEPIPEHAPEPSAPALIDPVLLDIYRKETESHLDHLRQFIADCGGSDRCAVDDGLIRALHTLHGSSRTAGIAAVADLSGPLEHYARYLQEKERHLGTDGLKVLADVVDFIEHLVPLLAEAHASLPDDSALRARIEQLQQQAQASPEPIVVPPELIEETPALDLAPPEPAQASPEPDQVSSEPTQASPEPDHVPAEQDQVSTTEAVPLPEPVGESVPEQGAAEYDEELLDIFLEEGAEILDTSDNTLQQWIATPNAPELVETMQRELHTLKGGARMAGVVEIGDLSHKVESLLTAVADGHVDASKRMFDVLQLAQDRLAQMLEGVRERRAIKPAADLIIAVEELLPGGRRGDGAAEARIVAPEGVEKLADEPPPPSAPVPESAPRAAASGPESMASAALGGAESPPLSVVPIPDAAAESREVAGQELAGQEPPTPFLPKVEQPEEDDGSRDRRRGSRIQHEQVRVRADLLDNLVNFAGEVSIYRSRLEQQVNSFRFNLTELDETVARLREQLRQFEIETEAQIQHRYEEAGTRGYDDFDPLEFDRFTHMQQLSRSMLESLSDLDSLKGLLANLTRESETLLLQQSRVNTDLQEGLMRSRMVPFAGQAPRLRRIVRQACHDLGKQAELQLVGAENELDRTVLDRVMAPLEHMLRNAIAHGIEMPKQRAAVGKPASGTIALAVSREGSEIVIRVSDDGGGIDIEAIRRKAIARGRIEADSQMTEEALLDLILESGFSTAETVTQIAGRGVGMDVVNSEIKQLGGTLTIDTRQGQGTLFTVRLPLTLSVTRALLVNAGEETFAVPLLSVEGIERISHEELAAMFASDNPVYDWLGQEYDFMHLGAAMGLSNPAMPTDDKKIPLLLTRSGDYRAALYVDGLIGSREVVVKSVGPQLSTLHGISGATIMGDGTVVLILDLGMLVRHNITHERRPVIEVTAEPEAEEEHIPTIMVVDDSITVRKVTARLLERNNMNVVTAKDGVDALALLQEQVPDVMLLDIEMPRMDGFELATNVRNDERLRDVPIIMITSRTGAKHRDRAMGIGVDKYMGKPFQESDLLENIQELLVR